MWFLPLYDENPSFRKPILTYAIMALCVFWYFGYQISQPPEAILEYGFIPARLFADYDPSFEYGVSPLPVLITFITTMISHGGLMHIFGNLYVMYLLADNVEDAIGHGPKFIVFFALITGTIGTVGHGFSNPDQHHTLGRIKRGLLSDDWRLYFTVAARQYQNLGRIYSSSFAVSIFLPY